MTAIAMKTKLPSEIYHIAIMFNSPAIRKTLTLVSRLSLKNGKTGLCRCSATTRPRSSTSCSASFWYGNLSDIFGQLKCKRTSIAGRRFTPVGEGGSGRRPQRDREQDS